jgi:hypothetical protein
MWAAIDPPLAAKMVKSCTGRLSSRPWAPSSGSTGSGDARDRDPCGSERFPFLAAAAKHERISAHQPHDVGGRSTAGAAPDRNNAVKSLRQPGIVVSPMFVLVGNASAGTSLEQWRVSERCKA